MRNVSSLCLYICLCCVLLVPVRADDYDPLTDPLIAFPTEELQDDPSDDSGNAGAAAPIEAPEGENMQDDTEELADNDAAAAPIGGPEGANTQEADGDPVTSELEEDEESELSEVVIDLTALEEKLDTLILILTGEYYPEAVYGASDEQALISPMSMGDTDYPYTGGAWFDVQTSLGRGHLYFSDTYRTGGYFGFLAGTETLVNVSGSTLNGFLRVGTTVYTVRMQTFATLTYQYTSGGTTYWGAVSVTRLYDTNVSLRDDTGREYGVWNPSDSVITAGVGIFVLMSAVAAVFLLGRRGR